MFNWNVQHLRKASAVSPNTAMPDFNFKPEESRALTLLLLSWRRLTYPPEYIPDPGNSSGRDATVACINADRGSGREAYRPLSISTKYRWVNR